jgi:hypothetical protein
MKALFLDQRTMDKYTSKYSNGKSVSAVQYITELICENKARKDKTDLHYRFWTTKSWSAFYRNQIASANKLIEKYDAKAIIAALRHKDAERIYSLRAPHLPAIIEKMQNEINAQNTILTQKFDRKDKLTLRPNQKTNSIISRLEELE